MQFRVEVQIPEDRVYIIRKAIEKAIEIVPIINLKQCHLTDKVTGNFLAYFNIEKMEINPNQLFEEKPEILMLLLGSCSKLYRVSTKQLTLSNPLNQCACIN